MRTSDRLGETLPSKRRRGYCRNSRWQPQKVVGIAFLVIVLIAFTVPTLYAVLVSFQPPKVVLSGKPQWIFVPTVSNFVDLFQENAFIGPLLNSAQSSLGSAVVALAISVPAAYALSRGGTGSAGPFGFWLLAARALPAIGLAIPAYAIFNQIGITDTILALLLVYLPFNVAFGTIMLRTFFNGIPKELDESASLDGAGPVRTLWQIVLPVASPGIASVALLTFLFSWNNFLFPLILTGSNAGTIPLALQQFIGSYTLQWNLVMAGVVVLSLPILVLGTIFSRYMVGGLAAGSVK